MQDMEFELVRPNFAQLQAARASEDSNVLGRENSLDLRQDGFLRADSPAVSVGSGGGASGHRSLTVDGLSSSPSFINSALVLPRPAADAESSIYAHRQWEPKWMALMSTSPPAQARKNKKVRKLLLEGVPSSVCYLVWIHLTDISCLRCRLLESTNDETVLRMLYTIPIPTNLSSVEYHCLAGCKVQCAS